MARDPSFPPPLSEIVKSGIGVAATPSGGKGLALDSTAKVPLSTLPFRAVAFGSNSFTFAAAATSGIVSFGNLLALRQPDGTLLTPSSVVVSCGPGPGGVRIGVTVSSVFAGGASFEGYTITGAAVTGDVSFYYVLFA